MEYRSQETIHAFLSVNRWTILRDSIDNTIRASCKGCSSEETEWYVQEGFDDHYNHAIALVTECFAEFVQNGRFEISEYDDSGNEIEIVIKEFSYSNEDLCELIERSQGILNHESAMYRSWEILRNFMNGSLICRACVLLSKLYMMNILRDRKIHECSNNRCSQPEGRRWQNYHDNQPCKSAG